MTLADCRRPLLACRMIYRSSPAIVVLGWPPPTFLTAVPVVWNAFPARKTTLLLIPNSAATLVTVLQLSDHSSTREVVQEIPFPLTAGVAEWYRYRIVASLVTSSSPVPQKTHLVGQRRSLNLSRAETSSVGVVLELGEGVPAQVSSTSLNHGSKLHGPSPKALV
ncbi:hypothetical protein TNCV_4280471 [Trichonephila clavipes]|nr:hypothetical protein TNCV_4280471 [Trichonephila clavipes]